MGLIGNEAKEETDCVLSIIWTSVLSGPSSLGVPGLPWHTQILAYQLTLFQPGGTDCAHLITTGTPGFSDLPTSLAMAYMYCINTRWDMQCCVIDLERDTIIGRF